MGEQTTEADRLRGWCEMALDRLKFGGPHAAEQARGMLTEALAGAELPLQRSETRPAGTLPVGTRIVWSRGARIKTGYIQEVRDLGGGPFYSIRSGDRTYRVLPQDCERAD
jgi:hypothetical protein